MRQLWDGKRSVEVEAMDAGGFARLRPASAGGRSRGRMPAPETASRSRPTSGRSDAFDEAVADFAEAYADQNERDFAELSAEAKAGRLAVRTGL